MKYIINLTKISVVRKKSGGSIIALLIILAILPRQVLGHGGHEPQPIGIVDPLVTHHAILEDELKLNYFNIRNDDENSITHLGSLEMAYAFTNLLGVELFIPFGLSSVNGGSFGSGLGDMELLIPKISLIRNYGFVMTTHVAIRMPTASGEANLGKDGYTFAPHLFVRLGYREFWLTG